MACTAEALVPEQRLGALELAERDRAALRTLNTQEHDRAQATEVKASASPDTQEDAGASSGESNTEKAVDGIKNRQGSGKGSAATAMPAPGSQGNVDVDEKVLGKEGKGDKSMKLPRPEGNARCPRCESEDTKFCYYNNYNIKQPRYFCKACQRYWTAGGTLRNVPVGAGRRKNKNSAARESEKQKAKAAKEGLEPGGFVPFAPLMGLDQSLGYTGPLTPSKTALAGFVPNLAVAGQLSPLAMPGSYPPVDPSSAAVVAAALPSRLAAGLDPVQFGAPGLATSSQRSAEAVSEDGSRGGRRVRARKGDAGAARPADSSQHGSASTATLAAGVAGHHQHHLSRGQQGEPSLGPTDSSANGGLSSFQPFQTPGGAGFAQPPVSGPMAPPDWFSMAAAANQQQAVAAQQQLQYQAAAAMQAQAMQAAAAGAWPQGNNPYLSGLCFPYNLYGAGTQWAAAYASLGAQPWNTLEVASVQGGVAGAAMPQSSLPASAASAPQSSQPGAAWGTGSSGNPQSWSSGGMMAAPGQNGSGGGSSSVWPGWPSQGSEMSSGEGQPAQTQHSSKTHQHHFSPQGMPGLHGANSSLLSGNSGNSTITGGNTDLTTGHHHHHSHSFDTGS